MEIKIINFDKKYSKDIYELETSQWGVWDNEAVIEEEKEDEIILIALCNEQFAGVMTGKLEQDVFHLQICCIKPEFQKMGIGTLLAQSIIKKAKEKFKFKKFRAESISVYGKSNSKRLFEKNNFKIIRIDKQYWGRLYPNVLCYECFKKPCECDSIVFELDNIPQ